MTKKDYELIAGAMWRTNRVELWTEGNKVKRDAKMKALKLLAVDLSASLKHDNPKFNKSKFLQACGF